MKYLCFAYEEGHKLDALSRDEWDSLRRETLGGFFLIEVRPIEESLREESRYGGVAEA